MLLSHTPLIICSSLTYLQNKTLLCLFTKNKETKNQTIATLCVQMNTWETLITFQTLSNHSKVFLFH